MQIKILETNEDWKSAYPLIQQLRPHLSEDRYSELLKQMPTYQGWVIVDGTYKAFIGFEERLNFYNEKHLFVLDFVTNENERSKGYGESLMNALFKYAKEYHFAYVALESGLERYDAHRFYESKMGFNKWCYSFIKKVLI
ncbi:GNAT family N-acetyltransferase [Psychrobacillus sp. NPDC058041]|uniref:GNAT family N-acetyltransferase n=1 Tax=Psychrobacillus sp. NPDC058041 TaxID=3346310 RepID=UPI0036DEBFA7